MNGARKGEGEVGGRKEVTKNEDLSAKKEGRSEVVRARSRWRSEEYSGSISVDVW